MSRIATNFKLAPLLGLIAALLIMGGCVPSEEDFKSDHPAQLNDSSPNGGGAPTSNGSGLTCPSSFPGSGTVVDPWVLGTAPVCDQFSTTIDNFYTVTIPSGGIWFFQIVNMTGDMDLEVYADTNFSNLLCFSSLGGISDDVCEINLAGSGTGGILVEFFEGGTNSYRLEVVQ